MLALSFMIAGAVAEPAPAPPVLEGMHVFATITSDPALERLRTRIEIGRLGGPGADRSLYWYVRTRLDGEDRPVGGAEYTNSALCPRTAPILLGLEALDMPRPDVPGLGNEETVIVLDGILYTLKGVSRHSDGQFGQYEIESNVGSPLADWIEALEAALRPCWRPLPKR